ncbi:chloramphenicol resistance leader peptide [Plantibacter sp. MPB07]
MPGVLAVVTRRTIS